MSTRSHLVAGIVLALACEPWMSRAEEPTWVTAKQLLAMPTEFDGKRISVMGYCVDSFGDGSRVFVCPKAAKSSKGSRKNIWIDQTALVNPGWRQPSKSDTGNFGELRFEELLCANCGHFSLASADKIHPPIR